MRIKIPLTASIVENAGPVETLNSALPEHRRHIPERAELPCRER